MREETKRALMQNPILVVCISCGCLCVAGGLLGLVFGEPEAVWISLVIGVLFEALLIPMAVCAHFTLVRGERLREELMKKNGLREDDE